jgi:hypothetical protein
LIRSLSQRITKVVMPDDEPFEYLSTQAIADFLATECDVPLDGIIFPSVQVGENALNVVLFHKAARVESLAMPDGTEIRPSLGHMSEEGWEPDYTVLEEVPGKREAPHADYPRRRVPRISAALTEMPDERPNLDPRQKTLKIAVDSVKIHVVRGVEFRTDEHDVRRHRWEKREPPF